MGRGQARDPHAVAVPAPIALVKKDPNSGGVALLLTAAAQEVALGRMELTDLWGVARRTAEKLTALRPTAGRDG